MKNLIMALLLLIYGSAFAQEKPKEIKQVTTEKTVKVKDNEGTKEAKMKVVTRETADVALDEEDKHKINQDRVNVPKKVEKMVMVNDGGEAYNLLSKETYFVMEDDNYMFVPTQKGFHISSNNNESADIGKAWSTSVDGYYILNGGQKNGIGYFDDDGNFTIEYYDKKADAVIVETYLRKQHVN